MAVKVEGIFWVLSVIVRFLWTLYPQTGYIHPDEFFQSPEITAGDILAVHSLRTWEFNVLFPVRSIVFPHLLTGLPFWIFKALFPGERYMSTTVLLILPRILFFLISLIVDFCGYRISRALKIDPAPVVCIIGTSFTSIVFLTRPFSNSVESCLFALLLWIVTEDIINRHSGSSLPEWRKKTCVCLIGVLVSAGFWNRPTFLGFAVVPVLGWFYSLNLSKISYHLNTFKRIAAVCLEVIPLAFGAILTAMICILLDSMYFSQEKTGINIVITPLNFLKYNLDSTKIKEHGIHPRITHFFVNLPLLFGILSLCLFLFILCLLIWRDIDAALGAMMPWQLPKMNPKKGTMMEDKSKLMFMTLFLCVLVPVGLLSIMPHQEPRFILPVLLPLAVLFSHLIIGSKAYGIITLSWIMWNVLGCIIFGSLHQGGLVPCLSHLQHLTKPHSQQQRTVNIVFMNTYMPPRHLLGWPVNGNHKLEVHDLAGGSLDKLSVRVGDIMKSGEKDTNGQLADKEIFVVCPSKVKFHKKDFVLVKQFFPHLSMEMTPDLSLLLSPFQPQNERCEGTQAYHMVSSQRQAFCERQSKTQDNFYIYWSKWLESEMSLNLYKYQPTSH